MYVDAREVVFKTKCRNHVMKQHEMGSSFCVFCEEFLCKIATLGTNFGGKKITVE